MMSDCVPEAPRQGPAADVPDVDAGVVPSPPTASSCPSALQARAPMPTCDLQSASTRPVSSSRIATRGCRHVGVVDREPPALGIERQSVRREVQRQPPDHPALGAVPDADAPLRSHRTAGGGHRGGTTTSPARHGCRAAPGVPGAIPAASSPPPPWSVDGHQQLAVRAESGRHARNRAGPAPAGGPARGRRPAGARRPRPSSPRRRTAPGRHRR